MTRARRIAVAFGVLLSIVLVSAVGVEVSARSRLARRYDIHRISLPIPGRDAEAEQRGKHLVEARYGCAACHGAGLGGGVMMDNAAIGALLGPNLTGGHGSRTLHYAMSDWDRIVRHGVKPDGSGALMPSDNYFRMSDAELSDIVAYIRSLPPVDNEVAPLRLGPAGKLLLVIGKLPIVAEQPAARVDSHPDRPPEAGDAVAFGAHIAAPCATCHGADFSGGTIAHGAPGWPKASNLTRHATGLAGWTYADFERALTEGVSRDGRRLREPMAGITVIARAMLPDERRALWVYLSSLRTVVRGN